MNKKKSALELKSLEKTWISKEIFPTWKGNQINTSLNFDLRKNIIISFNKGGRSVWKVGEKNPQCEWTLKLFFFFIYNQSTKRNIFPENFYNNIFFLGSCFKVKVMNGDIRSDRNTQGFLNVNYFTSLKI